MKNVVWTIPNCFSDDWCDRALRLGLQNNIQQAYLEGNKVDTNMRRSKISWINDNLICNEVFSAAHNVNRIAFGFNLYPAQEYSLQFTSYDENENGHYDYHIDSYQTPQEFLHGDRKLSVIIQLTNPEQYEGGNLFFHTGGSEGFTQQEFLGRGSIIAFPSFLLHKITPVTKGTRNSIVTWLTGPEFN